MMPLASFCLLATLHAGDPVAPTPFDAVLELELTDNEPARVEFEVEFEGTLHV